MKKTNKFGVPFHSYTLTLSDRGKVTMDVGCEEDWGNVQPCVQGDCEDWEDSVGWGNDSDGHMKIVGVVDDETGKELDVRQWAEDCVWKFVDSYSC